MPEQLPEHDGSDAQEGHQGHAVSSGGSAGEIVNKRCDQHEETAHLGAFDDGDQQDHCHRQVGGAAQQVQPAHDHVLHHQGQDDDRRIQQPFGQPQPLLLGQPGGLRPGGHLGIGLEVVVFLLQEGEELSFLSHGSFLSLRFRQGWFPAHHPWAGGLNADCFTKAQTATDETLEELDALLETAGGFCTGKILQNRHTPDSHSFVGEGKALEVRMLVEATESTMVIFDNELSPGHIRKKL